MQPSTLKIRQEYSRNADKAKSENDIQHTLDNMRQAIMLRTLETLSILSEITMVSLNRLSRIVEEKPDKQEVNKIKEQIKNEVKMRFDPLLEELDKQKEREKRLSEEGMYS